jgi:NAD-dependent SIR2 family protein deacetylase
MHFISMITSAARLQVPVVRPDGDIELGDAGHHFKVAPCSSCGGQVLKPDVVFFGDSVPKDRVERWVRLAFELAYIFITATS